MCRLLSFEARRSSQLNVAPDTQRRDKRDDAEIEMVVQSHTQSVSPLGTALTCRCPRCGNGKLFVNVLNMRDKCDACGLDYKFVDTGDGPAVFAIFILGFLCIGGALIAEFKFGVPWWVHVLLWGILTPLLGVLLLRFLKALLIALQFKNKAEEGRLSEEG
ncbi:DUF983 domain-containing protein [Hyphomicrobium sp. MC8b]|uniref:DUF983 domain-containing protein n=1 Tax=Hyphomicrobium sp. MC8b TaxID=300273 RepID=UPI00391877B9